MLKLKFLLPFLILLNAQAIEVVITSKKVNFKEKITASKIYTKKLTNIEKGCTPVTLNQLKKEPHRATHYMRAGTVICTKDVSTYKKQSIMVKFGAIEIEKNGKLIYENDEYLRIKKENGKIEKIYKDGRLQ